jgi:peptidyl-tRNA hydrolase
LPQVYDLSDFVLKKYGADEAKHLDSVLGQAKNIVETGLTLGWERAGSDFNRRSAG